MKVKDGDIVDFVEALPLGIVTHYKATVWLSYDSGLVKIVEPVNNDLMYIHERQIIKKHIKKKKKKKS